MAASVSSPRAPAAIPLSKVLVPREHGAWAQLLVPLASALTIGGFGLPGLAVAGAALAAFMGHEPLLVLLGHRGPRAKAQHGELAARAVAGSSAVLLASLLVAARSLGPDLDLLAPPLLLGAPVLLLALRKRERTLGGELLAACALAAWSVPAAHLSGASRATSLWIGLAFAAAFALSTFAVRGVIANHKHPEEARGLRAAAALGGLAILAVSLALTMAGPVPTAFAVALVPMELFAMSLSAFPPHPRHLYRVGFSNLAASLVMAVLLVLGLHL